MNRQTLGIGLAVGLALLALVLGGLALNEAGQPSDIEAMGVTNLSSLTLSDDLVVGDDASVTGDLTVTGDVAQGSNYALLFDTADSFAVVGGASITGTASYAHGLTTVEFAICAMNQVADDDAGDAARCVATYGSTTVTVTLYQDDWVTQATEASIPVTYLAVGQ